MQDIPLGLHVAEGAGHEYFFHHNAFPQGDQPALRRGGGGRLAAHGLGPRTQLMFGLIIRLSILLNLAEHHLLRWALRQVV